MVITTPAIAIFKRLLRGMISSFSGGRFITFFSGGSIPKDWAGGPSIIMLIHKTCMGLKGIGKLKIDADVMVSMAPMLVES